MAITLTLTNAGSAALTSATQARSFVFNKMKLGTGRQSNAQTATDLATPYAPVKEFALAVNGVDRQENQVSLVFVDQDETATYSPTEIGVYTRNTADTADILVGYHAAAAGQTLFTKPTGAELSVVASIAFAALDTTTITFSSATLNPATESTTGSVRLATAGQSVGREVARPASQAWRSLTRAGPNLYVGDTGTNFARMNPFTAAVTALADYPTGAGNVHGLTWGGNDVDSATVIYAIGRNPSADVLLEYTIATDAWRQIGQGLGFSSQQYNVVAMANRAGTIWAFFDGSPPEMVTIDTTTGALIDRYTIPATVTGARRSAEWVGDDLYIWTTTGQWVSKNIPEHIADSSVAILFQQIAHSTGEVVGSAWRNLRTAWVLTRRPNLQLAIIDLATGVVTAGQGIVFSAADIDRRVETYGFLTEAPPESFTAVTAGNGLEGAGTPADPLEVDTASVTEYAAATVNDKVLTPASVHTPTLPEMTAYNDAEDLVQVTDVSDSSRKKRISVRNFARNLLSRATTTSWGTAIRASVAQARAGTNQDAYLTPQTGTELVKNFDTDELTQVNAQDNDVVILGDTSGGGLVKRATVASVRATQSNVQTAEAVGNAASISVTTSWKDISTVTITPHTASNAILVDYTGLYRGGSPVDIRILRGTAQQRLIDAGVSTTGNRWSAAYMRHVDRPNTTSELTYTIQAKAAASGGDIKDSLIVVYEIH